MSTLVMVAPKQAIDQAIKEGYPQRAGGVLVGGVLFKAQAPISFSQDGMESMNDREMLELAAKAAGYEVLANKQAQRDEIGSGSAGLWIKGVSTCWNPLYDDGGCARLEAACGIAVEWHRLGVVASVPESGERMREVFADHGGDKNRARRYASLRAAAVIGKAMP